MSVIFYITPSDRSPVEEFLDEELTIRQRAQAVAGLALLDELGPDLGLPWVKKIGGDLWELRVRADRAGLRFLFGLTGRDCVVLHALKKKTNRLPLRDHETARNRWREYRAIESR